MSNIRIPQMVYPGQLDEAVAQFKYCYLVFSLAAYGGNISTTARMLGVSRRTIQLQVAKHGINIQEIRRLVKGSTSPLPRNIVEGGFELATHVAGLE